MPPKWVGTGTCHPNGSLFYEKPPKHGSHSLQKIPKGGFFWLNPIFSGFQRPWTQENFENGYIFGAQSLKMGTLFPKMTPKNGYGFRGLGGTSPNKPNLSTLWAVLFSNYYTPPENGTFVINYTKNVSPHLLDLGITLKRHWTSMAFITKCTK